MFDPHGRLNNKQSLLTDSQYKRLVKNHQNRDQDHAPVAKFFDPMGAGNWLISELDPETGHAFGLCDLGFGEAELGYVDLNELVSIQYMRRSMTVNGREIPVRMGIERDLHFRGEHPMSYYVDLASQRGTLAGV